MITFNSKQFRNPISGSFQGDFTGNLTGTASFVVSSSMSISSSFANTSLSSSFAVTSSIAVDVINKPFLRNQTTSSIINTIRSHESIFNPSNLTILSNDIFIIESNAEYYVLDTVINSGSLIVSGTLHVGGALLNYGTISGPGIIE